MSEPQMDGRPQCPPLQAAVRKKEAPGWSPLSKADAQTKAIESTQGQEPVDRQQILYLRWSGRWEAWLCRIPAEKARNLLVLEAVEKLSIPQTSS